MAISPEILFIKTSLPYEQSEEFDKLQQSIYQYIDKIIAAKFKEGLRKKIFKKEYYVEIFVSLWNYKYDDEEIDSVRKFCRYLHKNKLLKKFLQPYVDMGWSVRRSYNFSFKNGKLLLIFSKKISEKIILNLDQRKNSELNNARKEKIKLEMALAKINEKIAKYEAELETLPNARLPKQLISTP